MTPRTLRRLMLALLTCSSVAPAIAENLRLQASNRNSREYVDLAATSPRSDLTYARWVTEMIDGERRIDAFVFDCPRRRFAHILLERYRGGARVESIVVPALHWNAQLAFLPSKALPQLVHRVYEVACVRAKR